MTKMNNMVALHLQKVTSTMIFHPRQDHQVSIGLLDFAMDADIPDFIKADLVVKYFCENIDIDEQLKSHGTYSASLLVAQGNEIFSGLVPDVKLLFAGMAGESGYVEAETVFQALNWMRESSVDIVAMPIGSFEDNKNISSLLTLMADQGICLLAAAGNASPFPLMFPANHPRVISVGGADREGKLLPECCKNPDLLMPGYEVQALVNKTQIAKRSGSSVACIIAAAMAARLYFIQKDLIGSFNKNYILEVLKGININDIMH